MFKKDLTIKDNKKACHWRLKGFWLKPESIAADQKMASMEDETIDLSWTGGVTKTEEKQEQTKEDLVKEGEEDMEEKSIEDGDMDEEEVDEEKDEKEDGAEYISTDAQDMCPIDYAKYKSPTPHNDNATATSNPAQRSNGGRLTCDICGLACVSINVLLVHKRSHTGERPFHCTHCGASFTQKGNLLRHIKLHSGEKPFKCPMCSYACRRRDALSGHLRTHSVEKPYKCNNCGRSYKQRSSLEEHRERCHVYMQSKNDAERASGDGITNGARAHLGMERALLLDRLASNVAKRKSTMPQKFVGEAPLCLDLGYNRDRDSIQQSETEKPQSATIPDVLNLTPASEMDQGGCRIIPLPLCAPLSLTAGSKLDPATLGLPHMTTHHGIDSPHLDGRMQPPSEGHWSLQPLLYNVGPHFGHSLNNGISFPPHPLSPAGHPYKVLRVVKGEGETVGAYMCTHCRVLFLDYVMFTIHMGCHGFREPMECNVCGHLSRDCYEFSSHIARGEHFLDVK
ncbi:zinc finger protein Aiolos-like isoform X2 [Denticeps clupeoides]|uniref:C2H2-type domain-containing protein n=1 Tax=Denticeps clupeoides TaxID=299321 RepID=A0AAY4DD59_9TELE|nr:zinc finger protein Aiolos-like isoform X2 [Denticeps clupeoides]